MKNLVFYTILFLSNSLFSQIKLEEFYDAPKDLIIYSKVYELDSLSQEEIFNRLKNWESTTFVDSREVVVSENKDQVVLVYSTNKFFIKVLGMRNYLPWYIRLVIQIKPGKIRCLFYDDGNVFRPGSYSGGISVPSTPARRNRLKDYMRNGVSLKNQSDAYIEFRKHIILTGESLSNSIKNNKSVSNSLNNDW
jgi:hypothetical protein